MMRSWIYLRAAEMERCGWIFWEAGSQVMGPSKQQLGITLVRIKGIEMRLAWKEGAKIWRSRETLRIVASASPILPLGLPPPPQHHSHLISDFHKQFCS